MKLTIAPTDDKTYVTVSVESLHDDMTVTAVLDLIVSLLLAWGFQRSSIAAGMEAWLEQKGD